MTTRVEARFDVPAARVWELVRWENMQQYVDAGLFARVVYDERRAVPGATRTLFLRDGPPVRERLDEVDEHEHRYVYRLLDSGPLPVTDYVGTVRITADGSDACRLSVAATCTPVAISAEAWTRMYTELQNGLFDCIKARLAAA